MEHLWAPWRLAYVAAEKPAPGEERCFICDAVAGTDDRKNLLAARGPRSVVLLNRFPYNNGHLLVAPRAHKGRLDELDAEETLALQDDVRRMVAALDRLIKPHGYNVGLNLGKAAGAGLPGHLHWHIVPRWNGDTNYMTVIADVRIIAQSLDSLYDLLVNYLKTG